MEMSVHAKSAFIAEKIEAQTITEVKKKIVAPAVVVESQAESVSVETPTIEEQTIQVDLIDLTEIKEEVDAVAEVEKPKAKGRPKKTN
jgi:hypothetical protein